MLRLPFCARPQNAHHVRGNTKMMLTIFVSPRKWSARHALPPSCPSAPFPLPLPTQTQNGSQGRFCAKEGISKMTTSQLRTAGGGMVVCICPPYIQIKKRRRIFPYGCCPPCPPRPPCPPMGVFDIYMGNTALGGQQRTTGMGVGEFVVRPEKPDISRVSGLGGQGGQGGQQGGQIRVLVRRKRG